MKVPHRNPGGMAAAGAGTVMEELAWSPGVALRPPPGLEAKLGSLLLLLLLPLACGLAPLCCFRQPPSSAGTGTGGNRRSRGDGERPPWVQWVSRARGCRGCPRESGGVRGSRRSQSVRDMLVILSGFWGILGVTEVWGAQRGLGELDLEGPC